MELQMSDSDAEIFTAAQIRLYDITPMDYFSKTKTHLSQSSVFRAELWRRRHRQSNNGAGFSTIKSLNGGTKGFTSTPCLNSRTGVDIESVLTRNMNQEDLRNLIQHQAVEAMKLVRLYSLKSFNGRSRDDDDDDDIELIRLTETWASLDLSFRKTPSDISQEKQQTSKICKSKQRGRPRKISF